ncbi:MAG: tetratricopeptide repeat protein [Bryobacterales bacterium]|nr:tetratricopeptide repeat protein [Bryobacterales bacterium]
MLQSVTVQAGAGKQEYTRKEALRVVGLEERHLRVWERKGLLERAEAYTFTQLIALRALARLKAQKVPVARIEKTLAAIRAKLSEVKDPLTELGLHAEGKRIRVQHGRLRMDAESGQLLLDFAEEQVRRLVSFPPERKEKNKDEAAQKKKREAENWFQRGLEIEQTGQALEQAMDAYRVAIALDPGLTAAMVNLGTLYFNSRQLDRAEKYYRRALEVNPKYALALFNLGNLFDEKGDRGQAQQYYLHSLKNDPNYADAHYNLALLYQATGQSLKAVKHWRTYIQLDPSTAWADVARRELQRLYSQSVVRGTRE